MKTKHNLSKMRFYHIYQTIVQRCNNKNNSAFNKYGGKGIICYWKNFKQFKDDMFQGYKEHCIKYNEKNTFIDRINNNKGYYKQNCRWATVKEQANNKNNNTHPSLKRLAQKLNLPIQTIKNRLKLKWTIQEIKQGKKFIKNSKIESIRQYVKEFQNNFNLLTKKEKFIIQTRYGFLEKQTYTLKEVGDKLNITRERVRQIENKALNKLANF